ncbi:apolipoprotein N-acyltransferase [Frigidibacter sp. RF13]|uniref:apolipoprotein N-acyltransferase n=1 Tax=Frigidibacter sp. RF13 TaxID=2997340 RepID=UPI00226FB0BE|nr:apolipoprotein N-acyltransferase [Frigidibacter sp. RF13]MCY1126359.1 apolipoprotein N-acyltransferase [Frigidibacter sp. RF13]
MKRLKAIFRAALLPALAGVAAAAGQAPWGLWALSLFGYGVILWHVAGAEGWRQRFFRGWAAGTGHFAAVMFWIVEPFMVDPARDGWIAPFGVTFMATGMALFWGVAALGAGLGRGWAGRVPGVALGFVLADLARSYVLTGFPWALAGHIWIDTPVAQMAAHGGPILLSALTLGLVALPVLALGRTGPLVVACGCASALLAGVWAAGNARLAGPIAPRDPAIHVRLVQPNATQSLKWDPGMWNVFLDRMIAASAAPSEAPLDLIVWPETSVPYLLDRAGPIVEEARAASGGVPLAVGLQREEGLRFFNSLAVFDGEGRLMGLHDKLHLAPFGEYIPLGDLLGRFGISAFAAQAGNGYSAGGEARLLDLGPAGHVLPLICYEAVFPQDLRAFAGRADWILQVTNDGWFGALAGPYQHLAQARLRAIEQGLPLLRDANTGVTAVIDAKGRVLQALPLDTDGWIDTAVPPAQPVTLYARTGDIPATMLLLGCIGVMALNRRRPAIDRGAQGR